MREIKFRIRLPLDNNFKYFYIEELWDAKFCVPYITHVKSVDQYTGLKDKNGKEIYEGDIIKSSGTYDTEVKWSNSGFYVKSYRFGSTELFEVVERYQVTVIGNIYENPELLEK